MNFTTYDFYKDVYGGDKIPSKYFSRISIKASYIINKYTFNRVTKDNITDDIQIATCALSDKIYKIEQDGGIKISETIGKQSVTYVRGNSNTTEEDIYYKTVYDYLVHTGLMYRGLD